MARKKRTQKVLPFSRKIKELDKYGKDAGVYDLSVPLKDQKTEVSFLLIVRPTPASGHYITTVWASESDGTIIGSNPLFKFKGKTIKERLKEIGYDLV